MKYRVTLNNKTYEIEVERGNAILKAEYDDTPSAVVPKAVQPAPVTPTVKETPAPEAAPARQLSTGSEVVSSPLPGTIVSVNVSVGDAVKKDQVLMIIEAMKMENEITAPCDGIIAEIAVSAGNSVESGTPLISFA